MCWISLFLIFWYKQWALLKCNKQALSFGNGFSLQPENTCWGKISSLGQCGKNRVICSHLIKWSSWNKLKGLFSNQIYVLSCGYGHPINRFVTWMVCCEERRIWTRTARAQTVPSNWRLSSYIWLLVNSCKLCTGSVLHIQFYYANVCAYAHFWQIRLALNPKGECPLAWAHRYAGVIQGYSGLTVGWPDSWNLVKEVSVDYVQLIPKK